MRHTPLKHTATYQGAAATPPLHTYEKYIKLYIHTYMYLQIYKNIYKHSFGCIIIQKMYKS